MKEYYKGVYADFKNGGLKHKIYFIAVLIGLLPVIFSVFAADAYHKGADVGHIVDILALNAIILWAFIALALL